MDGVDASMANLSFDEKTAKKRAAAEQCQRDERANVEKSPPTPTLVEKKYRVVPLRDYWAAQWRQSFLKSSPEEDAARTRVLDTFFRVPYHLERFIWTGVFCCLSTALMLLTLLPLRTALGFGKRPLSGGALFDGICVTAVCLGVTFHLRYVEPGMLYFGMKDVTAEFLKITLVYVALDVANKIMCNVGVDVIRMLKESCDLYCTGHIHALSLVRDAVLYFVIAWVHSFVVMSTAMVWYVSMESEKTVLAFMIISNFGEIKTTVFKRFDAKKLFVLCRMDVVERLNLFIAALFIVVEDLGQSGKWTVNSDMLKNCALILVLESIVDVVKHSVVVNFNSVQPGIYRTYLKQLFQSHLHRQEEGTVMTLVFEPTGPSILLLRVLLSALAIGSPAPVVRVLTAICLGVVLLGVQVLMGWCLQWGAVWYLWSYDMHDKVKQERTKNSKQT